MRRLYFFIERDGRGWCGVCGGDEETRDIYIYICGVGAWEIKVSQDKRGGGGRKISSPDLYFFILFLFFARYKKLNKMRLTSCVPDEI